MNYPKKAVLALSLMLKKNYEQKIKKAQATILRTTSPAWRALSAADRGLKLLHRLRMS